MNNSLVPSSNQNALAQINATLNALGIQGAYRAEIRRDQPTAIVLLVDQSGSMNERLDTKTKAQRCADTLNNTLNEILNVSVRDGGIRNYIDIALIGYGAKQEATFLLKDGFMLLSELLQNVIRTEMQTVTKIIRGKNISEEKEIKIWLEPVSAGTTPMGSAFDKAHQILAEWINTHPNSFPPVVINISDGQATDCDETAMLKKALKIKELATNDGHVLLFNCHLGKDTSASVLFPQSRQELPDNEYAQLMYAMSSNLPPLFYRKISTLKDKDLAEDMPVTAMSYNAGAESLITLIQVGTQSQITSLAGKA